MNKQLVPNAYQASFTFMIVILMMLASPATLVADDGISIERYRSRDAMINHVYLPESSDYLTVSGYLHKTMSRRGRIPGHIHMDVFGMREQLLLSRTTGYHRHNRKSSYAHFHEQFPVPLDDVSKIVIKHHRPGVQ